MPCFPSTVIYTNTAIDQLSFQVALYSAALSIRPEDELERFKEKMQSMGITVDKTPV